MIAYLLLFLFFGISVAMVVWGLTRRDRIYQYPFLAGITWTAFLLPQAIGVFNNRKSIPQAVWTDGGLEISLLMFFLCALMGFVGYLKIPSIKWFQAPPAEYNINRLFLGGCALLGLSLYGYWGLSRLSGGGYLSYFTTSGSYALTWSGRTVMYNFFMTLVYPGILLCLFGAMEKPAIWKWLIVGGASALPLALIIILGRRAHAVRFALMCGLMLFFLRGWAPPRWVVVFVVFLSAMAIIVIPEYRAYSQLDSDWSQIHKIDAEDLVKSVFRGKSRSEFGTAVVIISAFQRGGEFRYGRGFFNTLVKDLVPRLLVGTPFKESLFLRVHNQDKLTMRYYGWRRSFGMGSTGPCDVFREFWLAGAFVYFFLAFVFHILWIRAGYLRSIGAQVIYVSFVPYVLSTVSGSVTQIVSAIAYFLIFVGPILWFAMEKRPGYSNDEIIEESKETGGRVSKCEGATWIPVAR